MLEKVCRELGMDDIPRSGKYAEDWPIQYYHQGLSPEDAIHEIEHAVAQKAA